MAAALAPRAASPPVATAYDDSTPANLLASFCFWNNKGGVGKSTLSFQAACATAQLLKTEPECRVLYIDLCPQVQTISLFAR